MTQLQTVQLKFLKRLLQAPNATPNALTFLELGLLPIEYVIHKRQLTFLYHILKLDSSEPVLQLYKQSLLYKFEENWANTTNELLLKYNLNNVDITTKSIESWKLLVTTNIREFAFEILKSECAQQTKTYNLQYDSFKQQPYMSSVSASVASFIFRLRGQSLNCKNNHHHSHTNLICRACGVEIESQTHIFNCRGVFPGESHLLVDTLLEKDFTINHVFLQRIIDRYNTFHQYKPRNNNGGHGSGNTASHNITTNNTDQITSSPVEK